LCEIDLENLQLV